METYNFKWKIVSFDSNTGICMVNYIPEDSEMDRTTLCINVTNTDEISNTVISSAPVQAWHRKKTNFDANTVIGLKGTGSIQI